MAKSIMFFGLTRGGSSITNRLLHILVQSEGIHLNDIGGDAYRSRTKLDDLPESIFTSIPEENIYVGPLRGLPAAVNSKILEKFNKVIVFRDPRDCLVSHYFAFKNIHTNFVEGKGAVGKGREIKETIDEYVLQQAPGFYKTYMDYHNIIKTQKDVFHFRYEDIIIDPVGWINNLCANLGIQPTEDGVYHAVIEAAFSKVKPNVNSHNRQGMWGDFKNQLQPETIEKLNEIFKDVIETLDYNADIIGYNTLSKENIILKKEIDVLKKMILKLMQENGKRSREITMVHEKVKKL